MSTAGGMTRLLAPWIVTSESSAVAGNPSATSWATMAVATCAAVRELEGNATVCRVAAASDATKAIGLALEPPCEMSTTCSPPPYVNASQCRASVPPSKPRLAWNMFAGKRSLPGTVNATVEAGASSAPSLELSHASNPTASAATSLNDQDLTTLAYHAGRARSAGHMHKFGRYR